MTTHNDTHTGLTALANRLSRLRSAERFYELRSELKAEALAIANNPVMVKRVTKFVRIGPEPEPLVAPRATTASTTTGRHHAAIPQAP